MTNILSGSICGAIFPATSSRDSQPTRSRPLKNAITRALSAETAPIPRFVNQFLQKYPDRVLYGISAAGSQAGEW
jgi:hypothetical protein